MKKIFISLFIVLFLLIITGCSKTNKLVGSWFYEEYSTGYIMERTTGMIWTFKNDGTCTFRKWGNDNYDEVKCSYEIDGNNLKVKTKRSSSNAQDLRYDIIDKYGMTYTISPNGSLLSLSFVDGSDSHEWKSFRKTFKEYYCNPDYQYHDEVLNQSARCHLPEYVQKALCDNLTEW